MKTPSVAIVFSAIFFMNTAPAAENFPKDVQAFLDKRDGCEHFRGEVTDPPEQQRIKEINREIKKLCTGTDKKLAALKQKYADSAEIMARLNVYENKIEPHSSSNNSTARGKH